jgi:hypothetical protein
MSDADKREIKLKYDIEMSQNKIYAKLKRIDQIMRQKLLGVLFEYNEYKNRY